MPDIKISGAPCVSEVLAGVAKVTKARAKKIAREARWQQEASGLEEEDELGAIEKSRARRLEANRSALTQILVCQLWVSCADGKHLQECDFRFTSSKNTRNLALSCKKSEQFFSVSIAVGHALYNTNN